MTKEVNETEVTESHTLVKKLAEIMKEVGYIPKNGFNTFHKYSYATESDVQDAVREKMAARSIIMFPNVLDANIRETKTQRGNVEYIATVTIEYIIEDGDSGESRVFQVRGEGQDAGDKAIYKAISGTQKYAIMKLFMIPTGNDPELENQPQVKNATNEQFTELKQLATKYCKLKGMSTNDAYKKLVRDAYKNGGFKDINEATFEQATKSISYLRALVSSYKPEKNINEEPPAIDADGNPI